MKFFVNKKTQRPTVYAIITTKKKPPKYKILNLYVTMKRNKYENADYHKIIEISVDHLV